MMRIKTIALIICWSSLGLCSPMQPHDKGKGVAHSPPQEDPYHHFSPGMENASPYVFPPYGHHYGGSYDAHPDYSGMNWNQQHQYGNIHGYSSEPAWRHEDHTSHLQYDAHLSPHHASRAHPSMVAQHDKGKSPLEMKDFMENLFGDQDMYSDHSHSDGEDHQEQIHANANEHFEMEGQPNAAALARQRYIDGLFDDTGMYSDNSQNAHSDEDNVAATHAQNSGTENDNLEQQQHRTSRQKVSRSKNMMPRKDKGVRRPDSRRYNQEISINDVQRLWIQNNLNVEMDPNVLARRVVELRLIPDRLASTTSIGKTSARMVESSTSTPDQPENTYLATFAMALKDLNNKIYKLKKNITRNPSLAHLVDYPQELEEYVVREAIHWHEKRTEESQNANPADTTNRYIERKQKQKVRAKKVRDSKRQQKNLNQDQEE